VSDELIVRHCAPTLAGIKAGSLFPYRCEDRQKIITEVFITLRSALELKTKG